MAPWDKWFKKNNQKRHFTYAGDTSRLLSEFQNGYVEIDTALRDKGFILRQRARQLVTDNAIAARYLNLLRANVLGPNGFKLNMRITNPDGSPDIAANKIIKEGWEDFTKPNNFSASGDISCKDLLDVVLTHLVTDGEKFIRHVNSSKFKYGYAIQLIDPNLLWDQNNRPPTETGNEIRLGIEMDEWQKPVQYWFTKPYKGVIPVFGTQLTGDWQILKAQEIIHVYDWTFANQSRGYTWLAPAMFSIYELGRMEEAEILKARIASTMTAFIKMPTEEFSATANNHIDLAMTPGMFRLLPSEAQVESFTPTTPTANFNAFSLQLMHRISASLNVSYMSLTGDVSQASYSSARVGLLEERRFYADVQRLLIQQVLEPIFSAWLQRSLELGKLTGANALPPSKFDKFNKPEFVPVKAEWIDPLKDTQAQVLAIENGLKTRTQALSEMGLDFEETMKNRANEDALLKTLGLNFQANASATKMLSETPPEDNPKPGSLNNGNQDQNQSTQN